MSYSCFERYEYPYSFLKGSELITSSDIVYLKTYKSEPIMFIGDSYTMDHKNGWLTIQNRNKNIASYRLKDVENVQFVSQRGY